ncbi:hypothetical protein U8P73_36265 (plasmid) [Rhizobium beringeri]|uniref:hypothetical protein n=1 Tax=Rhizobium beringeri TaxID=3019934 RepID=UPI002DDCCE2B|nr:hypothetical protein [Rhizobium beringeri]WSG93606.1 hypothetical protein U8P73_36265 [Rhizobium beringeri]
MPTDGINRQPFYTTQVTGLVLRHNWVPANSYGDNVYCRGLKNAEFAYNLLETPLGGAADNMQITSERNVLYPCSDVWIHHNTMVNVGGTSSKGNCVIEGCVRALVENNDFSGLYFCMSSVATFNTIRNNRMSKATYSSNSFTMGIGSAYDTGEQSWHDNRLSSPGNRAFSISGTGEASGAPLWSRYDLEINDNISVGHTTFFHQNRLMSGYFQYNVGQNNVSNTVSGVTTVATGGDYTTRTVTPNFLNAGEGPGCLEKASDYGPGPGWADGHGQRACIRRRRVAAVSVAPERQVYRRRHEPELHDPGRLRRSDLRSGADLCHDGLSWRGGRRAVVHHPWR